MARFPRLVHSTLFALGLVPLGACVDAGDGDDGAGGTAGADDGADGADDAADGNADDGGGGDPPTEGEVAECRQVCDRLLLWDCLTADTHETCYAICPDRSGDDIAQFQACVDNTIPECAGCWENLDDADPPSTADGGGDDSADSGGDDGSVDETTCEDACEEWLGAGCPAFGELASCADFCASIPESAHDLVVDCVDARDGCTLPESCTFEEGGSQGGG